MNNQIYIFDSKLTFEYVDSLTNCIINSTYSDCLDRYKTYVTANFRITEKTKNLIDFFVETFTPQKIQVNIRTTDKEILLLFRKNINRNFLLFFKDYIKEETISIINFRDLKIMNYAITDYDYVNIRTIVEQIHNYLSFLDKYDYCEQIDLKIISLIIAILNEFSLKKN